MCLNGERTFFHGINSHELHPRCSRCVTVDDMLFDIRFFNANNVNVVRSSHYPSCGDWYALCDSHGLYVINDANLELQGSWLISSFRDNYIVPGDGAG
jgi:beta-galactosidase